MFGDIFDGLVAVLVVESLVNRGSLLARQQHPDGRREPRIPEFGDIEHFKFRAEGFLKPDNSLFARKIDDSDESIFRPMGIE